MIEGKEIWVLILAPSFWAKISLLGASSLPELSNLRFMVAINFVTLSTGTRDAQHWRIFLRNISSAAGSALTVLHK